MLPKSNRVMVFKVTTKLSVLSLVVIMFFDIIDLLLSFFDLILALGLLDILFEALHITIEALEYSCEVLLEHFFHTDPHQSEIILVNTVIFFAGLLAYKLFFIVPKIIYRVKDKINQQYKEYKKHQSDFWHSLSLIQKIEIFGIYIFELYLLSFLFI